MLCIRKGKQFINIYHYAPMPFAVGIQQMFHPIPVILIIFLCLKNMYFLFSQSQRY